MRLQNFLSLVEFCFNIYPELVCLAEFGICRQYVKLFDYFP